MDFLRKHRELLAGMKSAAEAVGSPQQTRLMADLGKRMASMNQQADNLLVRESVTELTSLERSRLSTPQPMDPIGAVSSAARSAAAVAPLEPLASYKPSKSARPMVAAPPRLSVQHSPAMPSPLTRDSSSSVSVAMSSLERTLKAPQPAPTYAESGRELSDVHSATREFNIGLPVDLPMKSNGIGWMSQKRQESFMMNSHYSPPPPPPVPLVARSMIPVYAPEAPGRHLESLPHLAGFSSTESSAGAFPASAAPAVGAAASYATSFGSVSANARGSAGEGQLASETSAASATSSTPTAPPSAAAAAASLAAARSPPTCARTPSTSALKLAAESQVAVRAKQRPEHLALALTHVARRGQQAKAVRPTAHGRHWLGSCGACFVEAMTAQRTRLLAMAAAAGGWRCCRRSLSLDSRPRRTAHRTRSADLRSSTAASARPFPRLLC